MTPSNILILSANTGGGHASAAGALAEGFGGISDQVRVQIAHVLENASGATRNMSAFYNYLLRHRQDAMHAYYWLINKLRPNESRIILNEAYGYTRQLFDKVCPNALVSVHPMLQHLFAFTLKRLRLSDRVPLISVVTDPCYGFWRGWACNDVAHYFVASYGAQQQLLEYDVPAEKITVAGLPVNPKFTPVYGDERLAIRRNLGLSDDKLSVVLNAGWAGGGNFKKMLESLSRLSSDDPLTQKLEVVFIAGKNDRLRRYAEARAAQANIPVQVFGHTQLLHRWMQASDVMVSKLGGLTTFEAMACELPLLADCLTPPMPQEAHTASYIQACGTGRLLHNTHDLVTQMRSLTENPHQLQTMRNAAKRYGQPDAAHNIARQVLEMTQPHLVLPSGQPV
ncbi:MAG: glycosyltransferase [Vampirovibrionales bacterium]|nr:glycosyltransferase [Vampirovibrionales bacterium]